MVAETIIICLSAITVTGMVLVYLERGRVKQVPLNQAELNAIREEIQKLNSRVSQVNVGKMR
jgi:hypothetical protein